jgi:hypothetical protein
VFEGDDIQAPPAPLCPPDRCYGCWWYGRHGGRDPVLRDERTGRRYCHECMSALISWELDRLPGDEADGFAYPEWLEAEVGG